MNTPSATNYSPEDIKKLQEAFAADAKQYNSAQMRYIIPLIIISLVGLFILLLAFCLSPRIGQWIFLIGAIPFTAVVAFIGVKTTNLKNNLNCPACHNTFLDKFDRFCPECGSASIRRDDWYNTPYCNSCGKKLVNSKNHKITYRACTHCGILLDKNGL